MPARPGSLTMGRVQLKLRDPSVTSFLPVSFVGRTLAVENSGSLAGDCIIGGAGA